jgi:hypothetical protein
MSFTPSETMAIALLTECPLSQEFLDALRADLATAAGLLGSDGMTSIRDLMDSIATLETQYGAAVATGKGAKMQVDVLKWYQGVSEADALAGRRDELINRLFASLRITSCRASRSLVGNTWGSSPIGG